MSPSHQYRVRQNNCDHAHIIRTETEWDIADTCQTCEKLVKLYVKALDLEVIEPKILRGITSPLKD